MTIEERRAWIAVVVAVVTYGGYLLVVATRVSGDSVAGVGYRAPMLWAIGISIVSSIVLESVATGSLPKAGRRTDDRDRQIYRAGIFAGHWVLVGGAFAAMVLAMTHAEPFWIANMLYLGFTASAVVGAGVQLASYRRGGPLW